MFHTLHRTRISGARDFDRESERLVDELHRRGFFAGLGSSAALQVLADCYPEPPRPAGPDRGDPTGMTVRV